MKSFYDLVDAFSKILFFFSFSSTERTFNFIIKSDANTNVKKPIYHKYCILSLKVNVDHKAV